MNTPSFRRIAASAAALAAALAVVSAPAANADTLFVKTNTSVPAPYDQSKLLPGGRAVLEAGGPVMVNVRHTITCAKGTVRRRGYPATCQWSSALFGGSATVGAGQGQGDVYASATSLYPISTTFHAATLREGQVVVDEWNIIVRDDDISETSEVFNMSVKATGGGSLTRAFTIVDDD